MVSLPVPRQLRSGCQTTMPGDDSPGAASRANRGQATAPGKDGFAERIRMIALPVTGSFLRVLGTLLPTQ